MRRMKRVQKDGNKDEIKESKRFQIISTCMYVDIKCLKKRIGTLTYLIYMIPNVHRFSYLWLCNLQFSQRISLGKSSVSKGVSVTEVA